MLAAALSVGPWMALRSARSTSSREQARERFGGYAFGIHGASLKAFPIHEIVEILGELDVYWLELHAAQIRLGEIENGEDAGPPATDQEIRELRQLLEASDITPTSYTTIRLTADKESNRAIFGRAASLGVRNLTGIPESSTLDDLESLADEFGLRLAVHNNATGAFSRIEEVVVAIDGRGPNVGACLDIGHAIRGSEDPAEAVRRLGPRLIGIHVKDVSSRDPDSDVIVPGAGFLDVPAFFDAVREVGFPRDGVMSLEYLYKPDDPLPGIREGLQVVAAALT